MRAATLERLCWISPLVTPQRLRRFIKTASKKFKHGERITLNLIVPPSGETAIVECRTTDELHEFVKTYKGTLCTISKDSLPRYIFPSKYSDLSPSTTYEIMSPFFQTTMDERHHRQIFDKEFEQKCRKAMIRYLTDHKLSFSELGCEIQVAGDTLAEWKGIFELGDGQVWFLECKHCVTSVWSLITLHLMGM